MDIKDVLVREFTEILLFSEEIYGKIFLQAAEGLAQIFLARIHVHNVSFLYALSQTEATMFFVFFLLFFTMQFFMK